MLENHFEPVYERFQKQHPPNFEGSTDPLEAEEWLRSIESILDHMRLGNEDRVSCASHLLKKDARLCATILVARVDEFVALTQGNSTVTEYAQKFDRLEKFAEDLVPTEVIRIHRFVRGLKPMISRNVKMTCVGVTTYAETLERALEAELLEDRIWKERDARRDPNKGNNGQGDNKRKFQNVQGSLADKKAKGEPNKNNNSQGHYREIPNCPKCNRKHGGECKAHLKVCYKCRQEGHMKKECPQHKKDQKEGQKKGVKLVPARVFALTHEEAKASNTVVIGQIFIIDKLCKVLFDSGATHSFVSLEMIERLGRFSENLRMKFAMTLPSGEEMISSRWLQVILIMIENRELLGDLIELKIKDYDIILGMDWLAKHGATIDYR
ncbi:uncharacterized protein LOC133792491 [Humulus lupulus]|uniref:uncharacterized protein LOC133792491 n=1 Tax=Humulus lupulus TaxID=3486 RepID=UPI002B4161E5|nr:uncharacterized protein LOC133792491 [Humulus lupulus]